MRGHLRRRATQRSSAPPFSLRVAGAVSPSALSWLLDDGRASPASPRLASGLTAPVTQSGPLLGQATRKGDEADLLWENQ